MDYGLIIRPEARADLLDAFYWYQSQRQGLGFDFKLCIDEAMAVIQRTPLLYKKLMLDVRRATIRRFPFGVFYLVENRKIVVLAVMHAKRDPDNWKSRM